MQKDISILNTKIGNVKNELTAKMNSLDIKIDNVEKNLQKEISILHTNLNAKIDNIKNELTTKMNALDTKIDNVEKNLRKDLNMGNRLVHFMILAAAIFGPFIHSFLMQYIQGVK